MNGDLLRQVEAIRREKGIDVLLIYHVKRFCVKSLFVFDMDSNPWTRTSAFPMENTGVGFFLMGD